MKTEVHAPFVASTTPPGNPEIPNPKPEPTMPTAPYATRKTLEADMNEAKENHQYWRRQAAIRTDPAGIREARVRQAAWKTTLDARVEALAKANQP
jgi:hypothetical protein